MQGKTINSFTLQRLLGKGGMAEVWYAENKIGKRAAVKILLPKLCQDEGIVARFLTEAKVMVELEHPNIRQVYDYGDIDGRPAIVMEYLEGDDLKAKMKRGEHFSEEELQRWWNQLAEALNYTHGLNIVHRDIKPSNIFIDKHGNAKLLDFGIAKVVDTTSGTMTGSTLGTRIYMSPEQVKDPKRVGTPSDLYSLAVTFVHLLSGKVPYDSTTSSDYDIQVSIVTKPVDLSQVPDSWKGFLTPYLNKEPSQRPPLQPFEATTTSYIPLPADQKEETDSQEEETIVMEPKKTSNPTTPEKDSSPAGISSKSPSPNKPVSKENPSKRASSNEDSSVKPSLKEPPEKEGRSKKGLWIGIAAVAAAVLLGLLFLRPKTQSQPQPNPLEGNPDEQAYLACQTINDYREYLAEYGRSAHYYTEAKQFVENYVADSTAQAKAEAEKNKAEAEQKEETAYKECTTIAACQSYLSTYPDGRYVKEVKKQLAELKKNTEQPATNQSTTQQPSQAQEPSKPVVKGVFSVSSSKKVKFASGNVQYKPSSDQWRFAPNPWDVIGVDNKNITPTYSGWIDLFGYGTGDDPTKVSRNSDYTQFIDWGKHFKGGWRTLTKNEWVYVFHNRNTDSGERFAKAKVNGVEGVILLPDDWDAQNYELKYTNNGAYSYGINTISASTWSSAFEPNGAAFLPITYWRSLTNEGGIEFQNMSVGIYWSSTPYDNDFIYSLTFGEGGIAYDEHEVAYRYMGFAVRLVQPIKE